MAPRRNPRRGTPEVVETTDSEIEVSDRTLSGLFPESSQKPPRWPVKPEELKDHVDYSLFEHYGWPPVKRQLPPRQKRWIHQGDTPITDAKEVPEGWNPNDLDIDEDDVEAQIARCMERIEDGIMPQIFQSKLKMYRQKKSAREAMIDYEKAGLSWEVVQRLQNLRIIEQHVSSQGDPDNQLPNIDALIAAYSFEGLEFKPGIVSYWSKGERIGPPSEFHENVHKEMLRTFDTTKSWWVEGVSPLAQ